MAGEIVLPERTLVLVKPEALRFTDDFLRRIDGVGRRVYDARLERVSGDVWEDHYGKYRGKPFFGPMVADFAGKDVHLGIYEAVSSDGIIAPVRRLQGKTNPSEAEMGTIRGDYAEVIALMGCVIREDLGNGYFLVRNFIHASDSPENFKLEAGVWSRVVGKNLETI